MLVELLGRVIRRLQAKPDSLRASVWDHPNTLNVTGLNDAARCLGLGPILSVGYAPDWARAPNLPADHPANTRTVECLTVHHPDGSEYRIRRSGGLLDDSTDLPATETIARLQAWVDYEAIDSRVGLTPQTSPPISTSRRGKGRRKADYHAVQREAKIAADWQRARESGVYKPEFARQIGMKAVDLEKLLDRVRARKRRSDK